MNTPIHVAGTTKRKNSNHTPFNWPKREINRLGSRETCLDAGKAIHFDGDQRGLSIRMLQGKVWITQEGDREDHVLTAGEEFVVSKVGRVVVEGMRESLMLVTPAPHSRPN